MIVLLPFSTLFFTPSITQTLSSPQGDHAIEKSFSNKNIAPKLIWEIDGIGNGYSSPAINKDRIFITGEIDNMGYVFVFDLNGKPIWKKQYGNEWTRQFGGTRAAPTVKDDLVYICSGLGKISCFDVSDGRLIWTIDMINDLDGINIIYGYSMDLLINDELLYCFPGGSENNVVALDRLSGKMIWSSKGIGEQAGYGSPIMVSLSQRHVLVIFSEYSLLGFDAISGEMLWTHSLNEIGEIPCNTPLFDQGHIYYVAGPRNGAVKLKISDDGNQISEIWRNPQFDTFFGGFVKVDNFLYGANENHKNLSSININTGKISGALKIYSGSIATSDGLLFYYNDSGRLNIVEPNEGNPELIESFKIEQGTGEHFAHPIVHENILYIRHGDTLLAYKIIADSIE
ncbi:MAG: PQQ-like beta-propeller repeat protein [Candidatus Marinimicrobia bacterium]|nr:PQQ-like beta-propeller repeat protein [Candidatus Neomarinimicrobiota bacterium]MBT5539428.1 PQQ-like beta-propeller repeat protein [Candidatus Neomarinimicrobiota bacterium]MBT7884405.1 PQQ-like beta-propeller repeat protein [Candidatus Neomarinimicrobiota bacterium]MBT7941621.1 PQQ-like beta-propeller repeat protein [Candidatus Neomarinimicrobiota bacterium]